MAKMPAGEERHAPRVVRLATSAGYCTNEPKCPNYTGNHSAFSKSCPKWLFEKRVQQLKAEKGISFIEGRKIVSTESEGRSAPGGRTAAVGGGFRSCCGGFPERPHTTSHSLS